MIDSIVKKGAFHRSMPQDYVVAEDIGTSKRPMPFIALADGCSAGRHSEIGAMLITRAALAVAKDYYRLSSKCGPELQNFLLTEINLRLKEAVKQLDLELDDMIATLRVMYVVDEVLYTLGHGDGFDLFISADGTAQFDEYFYEINAPYYPAYTLFDKVAEYVGIGPNKLHQNRCTTYQVDDTFGALHDFSPTHIEMRIIPLDQFKPIYVGVASDGLDTYTRGNEGIKAKEIIKRLAQIKNPAGEFLVRRFQKMNDELKSQGYMHQDDIGIALINLDCYRATLEANK